MTITHTYTLNTRVRCVCDPHAGAGLEMSSKGLWETEKTVSQSTKGNRVRTPGFRVGVMQEMESDVTGQEGGSDSMHKQTTEWRGDEHRLRPDGQGTDIIPKEVEEGRGRKFVKKERN